MGRALWTAHEACFGPHDQHVVGTFMGLEQPTPHRMGRSLSLAILTRLFGRPRLRREEARLRRDAPGHWAAAQMLLNAAILD